MAGVIASGIPKLIMKAYNTGGKVSGKVFHSVWAMPVNQTLLREGVL